MKSSFRIQASAAILFLFGIAASMPTDLFAQTGTNQKSAATPEPNRGYTISKETTYFTGPLKPDGTIDFVAAINEHFAKGVTHENNAARIIVPLVDPSNWGADNPRRDRVLKALGLDPEKHPADAAFSDSSYFASTATNSDQFLKDYNTGTSRPWTDDELPKLAKFLSDNNDALDKIAAATRKDRYFVPLLVEGESDSLISILLEHVQATRSVARAFSIRANNHLGNGRWQEAWDDILAIKRLGRLVGQGQTLIEGLVGVAITGIACKSATEFIVNADPTEVDWLAMQELWEARPITDVATKIGVTERAMFVQMACKMQDHPDELAGFMQVMPGMSEFADVLPNKILVKTLRDMVTSGEVKLDDAMRYANQMYDRALAVAQMPNAQEREIAFEKLEKELVFNTFEEGKSPLLQVFFAKPVEPAQQFANMILGLVFPLVNTVHRAEWRSEASQHVVELALASRALQSRTGHLPDSLRELEPFVEEATMTQPSTGATVAFRADDQGILIYHWCANRVDDGGSIDGERPTDWGIRIAK